MDQSSRSSSIHQPHHTQMSTFSIIMMSLPRGQPPADHSTRPGVCGIVVPVVVAVGWDKEWDHCALLRG